MAVGAHVTVPAPVSQPQRYGLFSAATIVDTTSPHELLGIQWAPLPCNRPQLWPHDCPPHNEEKTYTTQPPTGYALPVSVYGSFDCRLVGYSLSEASARAHEHLTAGEQQAVEYALWTGAAENNPALANPDTTNVGTHTCSAGALSALYEHTDTHMVGEPTIHLPRAALPWLIDQLITVNGRLFTRAGSPVAAGAGYTEANTGPDGQPAPDGAYWIYATGPLVIRRGPIITVPNPAEQGFNTRTNQHTALAERQFLVAWDCITAAVLYTPRCG